MRVQKHARKSIPTSIQTARLKNRRKIKGSRDTPPICRLGATNYNAHVEASCHAVPVCCLTLHGNGERRGKSNQENNQSSARNIFLSLPINKVGNVDGANNGKVFSLLVWVVAVCAPPQITVLNPPPIKKKKDMMGDGKVAPTSSTIS